MSLLGEQIPGKGEDNFSYSFENDSAGYIAAFDGCGGMGSKKYKLMDNMTGARIASAMSARIFERYYLDRSFSFDGSDSEALKAALQDIFVNTARAIESPGEVKIAGNLFRSLPTTAAAAAVAEGSGKLMCDFLWAGDSRGYILDKNGLAQITADDLETEEDAFSNLRSDSKLSNVINADTDFVIHEKCITAAEPVIVIVSTDGSFGYYSTPMEFEYVLLCSLCDSFSAEEWPEKLRGMIAPYTGDDYTVVAAVYGHSSFEACRRYYQGRLDRLTREYIDVLQNADEAAKYRLWQSYRDNYYRWSDK